MPVEYKIEFVVQQLLLGDWVDADSASSPTQLGAEIREEKIHFENQATGNNAPETRIVKREVFKEVIEEVVG